MSLYGVLIFLSREWSVLELLMIFIPPSLIRSKNVVCISENRILASSWVVVLKTSE